MQDYRAKWTEMKSQPLNLYAIVPADEASRLEPAAVGGCSFVTWGSFAALVGNEPQRSRATAEALHHDRVVQVALESCSTVLPFRLGTCLGDASEVSRVLELNALGLTENLRRLRGRVEMGLKARIDPPPQADGPRGIGQRFFDCLGGLRDLAPMPTGRRERFTRQADRNLFDGRYLISRSDVERFWSAVEVLRKSMPAVAMIASGPWAPYSFGDVVLVQGAVRPDGPSWEVGNAAN